MQLNSLGFLLFFVVILILYYSLPGRWQNLLLLTGSYVFYSLWDVRFLPLLIFVTLLTYHASKGMVASRLAWQRKILLGLSIAGNLGLLTVFKMNRFFVEHAGDVFELLGLSSPDLGVLKIILPIGLSFFTLQNISYSIDIFRGTLAPACSLLDFGLYVAYFPKLIAGPVERARNFLPQLRLARQASVVNFQDGAGLVLLGLFKKVAIADPLSLFIDPVFLWPDKFTSPELLRAVLFYTLQIYCDFSGYTDLARGFSLMLGINLSENFNHPYFANSITNFWRRWHITLSNWFRDYVFFPLERKRRSYTWWPQAANVLIVFLLTGLWHGSSLNYLVWGGIYGVAIALELGSFGKWLKASWMPLQHLYTLGVIMLAWIFFRSPGVMNALNYLGELFSGRGMEQMLTLLPSMLLPWIPILLLDSLQSRSNDPLIFLHWRPLARNLAIAGMLLAIILGSSLKAPFIYASF